MVTEAKKTYRNIFSYFKTRAWRLAARRWYLLARQCFLWALTVAVMLAFHGVFPGMCAAQGTLVVPLGVTKDAGPAHQPQNFKYKENYFMLPVTSSGMVQTGDGQRMVVNKPVVVNPKRKTVIPLGGLTTQASPTPVVPEGFNARYVPTESPYLEEPAQQNASAARTYQTEKRIYSHPGYAAVSPPVEVRRYASAAPTPAARPMPPADQTQRTVPPAASMTGHSVKMAKGSTPDPGGMKPAPLAVSPPAASVLAQENTRQPGQTPAATEGASVKSAPETLSTNIPKTAAPENVYERVPQEMNAALPTSPGVTAGGGTGLPSRNETGYRESKADNGFTRLPERETPPSRGTATPHETATDNATFPPRGMPPQLPVPTHSRFQEDTVTEDAHPASPAIHPVTPPATRPMTPVTGSERPISETPAAEKSAPEVNSVIPLPAGQAPTALPPGPRPRRKGDLTDLYQEQTSTAAPRTAGGYAAAGNPATAENEKAAAATDSHSGIPVNMRREKKSDAEAYPTTLPPTRATESASETPQWIGPSV